MLMACAVVWKTVDADNRFGEVETHTVRKVKRFFGEIKLPKEAGACDAGEPGDALGPLGGGRVVPAA